jgi:uracil-DNA glycosylase
MKNDLAIDQEWKEKMKDFLVTDTCDKLFSFVYEEYNNKQVFPQLKNIFRAFNETPFSQVRVVIVGQDPYHNDNQANGLSFSVEEGLPLPPSLKNIYKEIEKDIGICKASPSGDLSVWARQGVFLLNAVLTVVAHTPTSHQGKENTLPSPYTKIA